MIAILMPFAAAAEGGFGFNYWPTQVNGCSGLNTDWAKAKKAIAADLDLMRSLNAKVLRLSLWPASSGFYQSWPLAKDTCKNLPEMISMMRDRGFKVIIAFSNSYGYIVQDGKTAWQLESRLGISETDRQNQFVRESIAWMNNLTDMLENSAAKSTILYYDVINEYSSRIPGIDYYLRAILNFSTIPAAKRGISLLNVQGSGVDNDVDGTWYGLFTQTKIMNKSFSFIEFHSYPVVSSERCPINVDLEASVRKIKSAFPNSIVVLGEFGRRAVERAVSVHDVGGYSPICNTPGSFDRTWDEMSQEKTELAIINKAKSIDLGYYLHWALWDQSPPVSLPDSSPEAQVYGYGYTPHRPKHVLGAIAAQVSVIPNADMEIAPQGVPVSWSFGSVNTTSQFYSGWRSETDAATHTGYARLNIPQPCSNCLAWIQSAVIPVSGGGKLFLNSFLRSNFKSIQMKVVQYDGNRNRLSDIQGPSVGSLPWIWNNYLVRVQEQNVIGGFSAQIDSRTRYILLTIGGVPSNVTNSIMDVDTVSAVIH